MSKELYLAELERLMSEGASYESACDRAHGSMMERLYDHADNMRKRAREEGAPSLQATTPLSENAASETNADPSVAKRANAPSPVPHP